MARTTTYSSRLALVRSPLFLEHEAPPGHPENAERMRALLSLFEEEPELAALPSIDPRPAQGNALRRVHAESLLRRLETERGRSDWLDGDTYTSSRSVDVAFHAAGAAAELAMRIWKGDFRRGFALVRPPGHHATPNAAMGFCLLNNVAIAAAAVREVSPGARIAIVDFDLHHGNGTQDCFYSDPDVLFVSSHRYPFYPGTGAVTETGEGRGRGTTINFPLAERYGDELFVSLYEGVVLEMLKAFAPDLILVSAGFDGHALDPMLGFRILTPTYARLTRALVSAAEQTTGKILFLLEGGYNPGALKDSVRAALHELRSLPEAPIAAATKTLVDSEPLARLREYHRQFFPKI